jgi:hypothetical protein
VKGSGRFRWLRMYEHMPGEWLGLVKSLLG